MTDHVPEEPGQPLDWGLTLDTLRDHVAHVQDDILLLHGNPEFINPDSREFKRLKEQLAWAEKYLFQAKEVRAYLEQIRRDVV